METKYVFVTNDVIPSHTDGIISSSLACLLKARGYRVTICKFDSSLNIDHSTSSPSEVGEGYLTEDGYTVNHTLGDYDRFADIYATQANYITMGSIYKNVLDKERRGEYSGKRIQITPHITDEIKRNMTILQTSNKYDFIIIEIGGIIDNVDTSPYIESIRQLSQELGNNCIRLHVIDVPYENETRELTTTLAQQSVRKLQKTGVQPDILIVHSKYALDNEIYCSVAMSCNVASDAVVKYVEAPSIYEIPIKLYEQKLDELIMQYTNISTKSEIDLTAWLGFLNKMYSAQKAVSIAIIGKFAETPKAYKSITETLKISSAYNESTLDLTYIQSGALHDGNVAELLKNINGVIIASDDGQYGIEGKISVAKWCRQHNIPTLGIGSGMHCMIIEYARNVLGLYDTVISKCNSSIDLAIGCDTYNCLLNKDSQLAEIYDTTNIKERHNNQYELDNKYRNEFEQSGMLCSGIHQGNCGIGAIELQENRWYIGVQYHPEYSNTVLKPHPLFLNFVNTAVSNKELN